MEADFGKILETADFLASQMLKQYPDRMGISKRIYIREDMVPHILPS